jgi:mannose-6-phosphate isomerase-like protein (cupin superfamily)
MEIRPWGSYTILEDTEKYKIKKVIVNPGEKLSLQMHHYRSEHWVIVKGMAQVSLGKEEDKFVRVGESIYVPSCTWHQLSNPGLLPLEVIEVEIGEYLNEDDIVRYEGPFNLVMYQPQEEEQKCDERKCSFCGKPIYEPDKTKASQDEIAAWANGLCIKDYMGSQDAEWN